MNVLNYKLMPSPVGLLKIVASKEFLVAILWDNESPNRVKLGDMLENNNDALLGLVERQLQEYFARKRKAFDLPLQMKGTPFQEAVWQQLSLIPYGKTCSYQEIAVKIDRPKAVRAVGSANGRNPISIVVPCHRVIAASGTLAGFAGGVERKRQLLELEV